MKFPYSMLLDYVRTELDAHQVGDLLTMAGFELEGIEEVEGDPVLDIKVMSNRGDGLSVLGLAREVIAKDPDAEGTELYWRAAGRFAATAANRSESLEIPSDVVKIESADCTRYACRYFEKLPSVPSPDWMQIRLRQAGMRPLGLLVDITNYVMLEMGQPLHAFDYEKLSGHRIVVRESTWGEELTTLNGEEHELRPGLMMICDGEKPVGAPGTMGGLETEVTEATTRILLESAHFTNTAVRRIRKSLGLNTEASYRFERSVDPDGVVAAIQRFTELLLDSAPDAKYSNIVDHYPVRPKRREIDLALDRSDTLLGMPISPQSAEDYLGRLGFEAQQSGPRKLSVVPPSWRPDVVREEDLIEELGRVHGYEKIPELLPHGETTLGGARRYELWEDQLREACAKAGFDQIISHSLRRPGVLDGSDLEPIGPRNPASPEMSTLRNSLLPSLAEAAQRNGGRDLHLFELGEVFGRRQGVLVDEERVGFLSAGELSPVDWEGGKSGADFFSLKGSLEAILEAVGVTFRFRSPQNPDSRLHPTRQAEIVVGSRVAGWLGEIHPEAAAEEGLAPGTVASELSTRPLFESRQVNLELEPVSKNPAVRRDMAILVDKAVPYERIAETLELACGPLLERHWLFENYEGKGIPEGKHSLNVALVLRKQGANLTDEEANQVRQKAEQALAELGATTR